LTIGQYDISAKLLESGKPKVFPSMWIESDCNQDKQELPGFETVNNTAHGYERRAEHVR
jgi:hypothetical protein